MEALIWLATIAILSAIVIAVDKGLQSPRRRRMVVLLLAISAGFVLGFLVASGLTWNSYERQLREQHSPVVASLGAVLTVAGVLGIFGGIAGTLLASAIMQTVLYKRWWFWPFLAVFVVAGYLVSNGQPRISQTSCDKIQLGMTTEEVAHLLGAPSYGATHGPDVVDVDGNPVELIEVSLQTWADEDGNHIQVGFDEGGRVLSKVYFLAPSLSFQERMKRKIQKRIRALWP
jgi:hypothetical protein